MKISFAAILGLLLVSFFVGCVVIALPISLIPKLTENTTARLICRPGTFRMTERNSDDGHHYTNYYCMSREGVQKDITFQALAVPGTIAAGVLFVVLLVFSIVGRWFEPPTPSATYNAQAVPSPRVSVPTAKPAAESHRQRLEELKDMYESNLISAEDYERKKKEILDQL